MPKTRELTSFERGEIVGLHKGQHNPSDISRILDIPRTTVNDVIRKWEKEGRTSPAPRSGRPPLLDEHDQRQLVRLVKEDRQQSLAQITENFNNLGLKNVSEVTIRRNLYELGYHGRAGVRKPLVSEVNRNRRNIWCRGRRFWREEWHNVIWSDESRFVLFQNDSHHWVWRRPHEKYDVDCLLPTVKQGSPGVMVWGCFINDTPGPLVIIEETVNAQKYLQILENHLLPFLTSLDDEKAYIFQDDNASVHRAKVVIEWKEDNLIGSLPWPAQSPDLNPIEHVWDYLERRVRGRNSTPKSTADLVSALREEWVNIDPLYLENLVSSMPRRVLSVIKNKGYPTKY